MQLLERMSERTRYVIGLGLGGSFGSSQNVMLSMYHDRRKHFLKRVLMKYWRVPCGLLIEHFKHFGYDREYVHWSARA